MFFLIKIGFFTVTIWDLLDVLIVGFILFELYKLLRGSLGFNIFIGLLLIYSIYWLVGTLEMPLLSGLLGQFISVGVIALLILFQPEVRRFLLFVGQGSLQARFKFLERLLNKETEDQNSPYREEAIRAITRAVEQMQHKQIGALMLFPINGFNMEGYYSSGVRMNAKISTPLILSIFNKYSPLHDGAMILDENTIIAASCVLPISASNHIPQKLGLRHRAAVGSTEHANVLAIIISEETGNISYAQKGKIIQNIDLTEIPNLLRKVW
ncbi:MAG: diadenylate cyclase [Saprospiraceae bacterium]|nr:diadenylate cyclase [Saprospiraceae bacterium]